MGDRFLDDAARGAFKQAVEAVEAASAVEVVIAVRRRSARYLHAHVLVGGVLAVATLALTLFSGHVFSLEAILVSPFVVGLVGGVLVDQLAPLIRVLTPASHRRREVLRGARAAFVERGVHFTTGRTGVLLYFSWLERELVLIADGGVRIDLAAAEQRLAAAIPGGGAAVARALEQLAPTFAADTPHRADDVNELPDAIDEGAS